MLSPEEIKKQIEDKIKKQEEEEKARLGNFKNEEEKNNAFLKKQEQIERIARWMFKELTGMDMLDTELAEYRSYWVKNAHGDYKQTPEPFINSKDEKTHDITNMKDFIAYKLQNPLKPKDA